MFQVPGHQTSTTETGYLIYLGFQEIDERLTNFLQLLTCIWARVDQLVVLGMGDLPPLIVGILIMGPYKPLRTWVDEFIPYYMHGTS